MELFRSQIQILNMLFSNHDTVSGLAIADYLNSSLKTVKKEIDDLNAICLKNGCEIISKVGAGYEVEVRNRKQYAEFREEILTIYRNHFYYTDAQHERAHYIVRRFLLENTLHLNDLVYACNVSESTIRRDLPGIRSILGNYKLYLVNRTNRGMSLEGDEWHIRLAFLQEDYLYQFMQKVYINTPEVDFENMTLLNHEYLDVIMQKVKKVLLNHSYILSFSSLIRFTKLLILTYNRARYASRLVIPSRIRQIDLTAEKQMVEEILASMMVFDNLKLSEEELFYLAFYLKGERSMKYQVFLQQSDHEYFSDIVDSFISYFKEQLDIGNTDTSELHKDLCTEFYKIYYRSLIDVHLSRHFTHQYRRDGLSTLDFCSIFYLFLKERYQLEMNIYDIAGLYPCFIRFFNLRDAQNVGKILVVSKQGYQDDSVYANHLNQMKSNLNIIYVPKEYMNLERENLSEYIGILSNVAEVSDEYPELPFRELNYLRNAEDIARIGKYFQLRFTDFQKIFTPEDLYVDQKLRSE